MLAVELEPVGPRNKWSDPDLMQLRQIRWLASFRSVELAPLPEGLARLVESASTGHVTGSLFEDEFSAMLNSLGFSHTISLNPLGEGEPPFLNIDIVRAPLESRGGSMMIYI